MVEWTDSGLRDYLLGSAAPEVAERIEARLLEDQDLFAALRSTEDDLFDAYARGRLAPAERSRFLERFGHETDRLRFASALAGRTAATFPRIPVFSGRPWISIAAAAAIVLLGGLLFTQLEAPAPVVPRQQPGAALQPSAFAVTVTLGTSRAASASTAITIPGGTPAVQLNVRLDPADRFDKYSMELRGAGDRTVWSGGDLTAATVDGHLTVSARVPTTALPAGSYELAVRGAGTDLGFVPLTVRWSP